MIAISHMWLLTTSNMASMTEEWNFKLYLIFISLSDYFGLTVKF